MEVIAGTLATWQLAKKVARSSGRSHHTSWADRVTPGRVDKSLDREVRITV